MNAEINTIIERIAKDCILHQDRYAEKINFSNGCSGIAVFFASLYKVTGDDTYREFSESLIAHSIDVINDSEHAMLGTLFNGISGIAWSMLHLRETGVIDFEDDLLEDFDEIITSFLQEPFERNEYDHLHGYLGIGFYVLERNMPDAEKTVRMIVDKLYAMNESAVSDEMYWHDYWGGRAMTDPNGKIWNLGLAHGIPAIVYFFCKCYRNNLCKTEAENAITKTLNWFAKQRNDASTCSSFPISITTHREYSRESRLGWCYGDFGALFAFMHGGKTLENPLWIETAKEIALKIATRKVEDKSMVRDACLCHGAAGIAFMLTQIENELGLTELETSKQYWLDYVIENYKANNQEFLTYYKRDDSNQENYVKEYGILTGISGVGLALLGTIHPEMNEWSSPFLIKL